MIEWDAYARRLSLKGETRKERVLNRLAAKIHKDIDVQPGCVEVLVDEVPQYIFTKRTDEPTKKNFNTLPGETINLGSVVFWENRHWLVTESLCDDRLTYHGSIEQCNRQLVWQNQDTREVIKRWCTISKPYYSNLDETLTVTISSREFKVQLPSDFESEQLDVGSRFMLEVINGKPKVYKCTSVDMNTKRYDVDGKSIGFIVLNIEQDEYNAETDNVEYGVCNYKEPYSIPQPTKMGWCILEGSSEEISPGGMPTTFSARFFDSTGVPINEEKPIWTVNAYGELGDALSQEILDDGRLLLTMDEQFEFIGQDFEVQVMNAEGTMTQEMTVKVVSGL